MTKWRKTGGHTHVKRRTADGRLLEIKIPRLIPVWSYELCIDTENRIVTRKGFDKKVEFVSNLEWHTFIRITKVFPEELSLQQWKQDYPGIWSGPGRRRVVNEVNNKLKRIGLKIVNRTLQEI